MSQTLNEKTSLASTDVSDGTTELLWVQKTSGTPPADRKFSLGALLSWIRTKLSTVTESEGGLIRSNTVVGAGTTHFVSGVAADGTLEFSTPPGAGDVVAGTTSTAGNVAVYSTADGKEISDTGIDSTDILLGANNLSDVADAAVAKTNLGLSASATSANHSDLNLNDGTNPHSTTKADVGLANVDNTADVDKPVSNAQQAALDLKVATSSLGVAGGVATLNGSGLVETSQLPSFVDDVLEYNDFAGFPASGETGKIYIDKATGKTYRWGGSVYIELRDDTAIWGEVGGTLSNQTDLVAELDSRQTTTTNDALALAVALG